MFRVILVDDEQTAVDNLKWELSHFTDEVIVIRTFTSPDEAIIGINTLKPDCVFLDIEMPGKDGFTLLDKLTYRNFQLVITTAYENYALKAFKENAIDYLLKPIDTDDLISTINRLKERHRDAAPPENLIQKIQEIVQTPPTQEKIALTTEGKVILVSTKEIIFCKSRGNYTEIFLCERNKLLISKNLKQIIRTIAHPDFIRVHQSYLINIDHITEYIRGDGGLLLMKNSFKIPVSRTYKDRLMESLKIV